MKIYVLHFEIFPAWKTEAQCRRGKGDFRGCGQTGGGAGADGDKVWAGEDLIIWNYSLYFYAEYVESAFF